MPFLTSSSIDNDALLVKIIGELRSALKAGNLNTGLAKTFGNKLEEVISAHVLGLDPKGTVVDPSEYSRTVVTQIGRLNEQQLYAGLTIMCKDILSDSNKAVFKSHDMMAVIEEFFKEEQTAFPTSELFSEEPVYKTSGLSGSGIKRGWFTGEINSLLLDNAIVHEWTVGPGQKLFKKFQEKFKDVICNGPDSLYEKIGKGSGDATIAIISALISKGLSASGIWVPVLAYFATLLVKTGLKLYCEGEQAPPVESTEEGAPLDPIP